MKVITANLLNRFWTNGVKPIKTAVGTISSLTTAAKTNLVAAINEVKAKADSNATEITSLNNNLTGYGTNTNGSYWKFPDGTLICAKEVTAQVTCATPWGALYESGAINLGNFPMAFKSRPFMTLSNTTQFTAGFFVENPIGASATSAGRTFVARATMTSSPIEYTICVIAIGRWK